MQVVDVYPVFDHIKPEVVGFANDLAPFDATAGHPHGEGQRMMIAAPTLSGEAERLNQRGTAKFTAPDHQRAIQQSSLLSDL